KAYATPSRSTTIIGRPPASRCASYFVRSSLIGAGSSFNDSQNSATSPHGSVWTSTAGFRIDRRVRGSFGPRSRGRIRNPGAGQPGGTPEWSVHLHLSSVSQSAPEHSSSVVRCLLSVVCWKIRPKSPGAPAFHGQGTTDDRQLLFVR